MEYSPGCAIPYVSRVDAGTVELVRQSGAEVVSSGDLIQRFFAIWDTDAISGHRVASDKLYRVKDRAFDAVALEAQHFQDTPHRPEFPTTLLKPGQTYRATTIYRFSAR